MAMSEQSTRELRSRLLDEHEQLRARISTANALAHRVQCGEPVLDALTREAAGLAGFVLAHMRSEDASVELLIGTETDATDRLRQLQQHHDAQLDELVLLLEEIRHCDVDPRPLAELVLHFGREARDDMAWEERNLLTS